MGTLQTPTILTNPTTSESLKCSSSKSGNPDDFIPRKSERAHLTHQHHCLSLSRPSFIIRSESNVRKMRRMKPEPSCAVCEGTGRVDCHQCHGTGRTNCPNLIMLPKGEWPKWCKTCGGSGLGYCSRCLGTGEYRDIMGFHFMKLKDDHLQKQVKRQPQGSKPEHLTAADRLLSEPSSEAEL